VSETVLVIGAGSGIGRALLRQLAAEGARLVVAGRRAEEMERLAADCRVRFGVEAAPESFDALDFDSHQAFIERCASRFEGGFDGVALCHGEMPDEADARADPHVARRMIDVNYTSAVSLLEAASRNLDQRRSGWILALGSVAGDRGRPGNAIYGSTKAALATYLSGLRSRMARNGIPVVTVKPGVVDTGMTWGLPDLPLAAAPERVARDAMRGVRRDRAVVYSPWFWAIIMRVIRWIPDRIFKRLDL
jgi:short-subunit dehydrogenase